MLRLPNPRRPRPTHYGYAFCRQISRGLPLNQGPPALPDEKESLRIPCKLRKSIQLSNQLNLDEFVNDIGDIQVIFY